MFTGIIEGIGSIRRLEPDGSRIDLYVELSKALVDGVKVGDSVALNGCCLTVTAIAGCELRFQAIPETLKRTSLGGRVPGDRVNVERALRANGRLDGHLVQGHVDATGIVKSLAQADEDIRLRVAVSAEIGQLLVPKGSVALDGVSLTVAEAEPEEFSVALIPHTLLVTTLGDLAPGSAVNVEVDVIGKYVHRYLERLGPRLRAD